MKIKIIFLFLAAAMFSACVSMKRDIVIDQHREQVERNLAKVESMIVPLEAQTAEGKDVRAKLAQARQTITNLEQEASADADYSAKLTAWSGRLAILEGKYSEAQRLYRQSIARSPGNVPSIILSIRLEGDPAKRLEMINRELSLANVGELQIERGSTLLGLNRFSESAGAFDVAFSSGLNSVYNESYQTARNRAWELRNTSGVGAGTLDMLGRDSINWKDCITITKNETQLLRFITGGRNISDDELFTRLLERAFIPYTQNITITNWPTAKPKESEVVTRAGAAWFIWHLYAEARANRGLLSSYSTRYATGANPRSPIADVPPLSPFFDSILGCVETEFLSLMDGRNFKPEQLMRGAELLAILKRIDN